MDLPAFGTNDNINVIIETPRGSNIKFVFDSHHNIFLAERKLGLGVTYPYDWGFVCGTRAEDDDPIDAMVIHDVGTFPGVLIECRPLAILNMSQTQDGTNQTNSRVIAVPHWQETAELQSNVKSQLEQFFLSAVRLTSKHVHVEGWGTAQDAVQHIRSHVVPGVSA
jgi:inorganic pyrophosphatase